MGKKKLVLLGGSAQQVIAIRTAKRLGYTTVLCDYLPDNPGQYEADVFYPASTTDKEAVLAIAQREKIDGILAYASDPAAPTAAYVAERLGLPTNPYRAVATLCRKDLFRAFLAEHGFNTPKAEGFQEKQEAMQSIGDFELPIIIKPVDSSGSKGVTVLHTLTDLETAIDFAFSFSRGHRIVIEEFIEKKHPYLIGGDIYVSGGQVIQWGLMNCHRDEKGNSLVPVGKSYPPLLERSDLQAVKDTLQRLVTELGIRFGPMNVELVVDAKNRVYPIDIGPRSGGNMIPDLLSLVFDVDVAEMSVKSAMGEQAPSEAGDGRLFYATHNLHSRRDGIFDRVEFSQELGGYLIRETIYKRQGDEVHAFSNAAYAIGIVFFKFPDEQTMYRILSNIDEHIHVVLKDK